MPVLFLLVAAREDFKKAAKLKYEILILKAIDEPPPGSNRKSARNRTSVELPGGDTPTIFTFIFSFHSRLLGVFLFFACLFTAVCFAWPLFLSFS